MTTGPGSAKMARTTKRRRRLVDYKLELVLIPVTDVDRAKAFYTENVGFRLDVDHRAGDDFRVVQMTPPGSACSISIGIGLTDSPPGTAKGMHLVVTDIETAREELVGKGVDIGEIRHLKAGEWVPGPDPQRQDYGSFAHFQDPDGNTWVVQEVGRAASTA
jgi:catechol 2,3-dioxygenase-like lactoylglutathione lyase family enzyme